ncbi:tRNA (adenosine(37)-N6)-threonylcarbamoyltransferase complex dimerization subunit type 1 TsaB [bacterium]|nr:tRNA (adenosine(37)-N6)-threonylcarbamoyltransferase complex dimerization subunit type 1 TsaB [bacterium]MCI0601842.1 tRNA (adenosine(37)-N6)-threonylcarbamoyltransferase complex dimerization subunit type 1 TsaB [bacterium]
MKILALDTSTNVCSVCIAHGDEIVAEYVTVGGKTHSERLMPAIEMLFSHLDFDIREIQGIAVINGPGSFTGLRISLSVVKGLAFSLQVPVVAASALEIAALQVPDDGLICPALDARRREIFTCLYEKKGSELSLRIDPKSIDPVSWSNNLPQSPVIFCGPGAHLYWDLLRNHPASQLLHPSDLVLARTLAQQSRRRFEKGEVLTGNELKAAYLRPSDAESKGPRPPKISVPSATD